ncbi:DUF1850 domain-containing protein [Robertmurraya massiliosenegalensis]|uniref:DUF1850 domain-containing protein n=1 Tax=Robertmurraya TaxID=2837507 RepID=UPI0039A732A4
MKKKQRKGIIFLVPLIILFITFLVFIPFKQVLVFEYKNTEEVLAYIPLKKEQAFKIKYTHSIHLSDVLESYKIIKNGNIQQYELMFEDFAIGMPSNASEGETFEEIDGKYYIRNMKQTFPYIDLRIGQVRANHRVIFQSNEYSLSDYIEPGTWVRIKTRKLSVIQQLKGVNIIES